MSAGRDRAINYSQFVQKLIKLLPVTKLMAPRMNIERTSGASFDVAGASASDSPSVYAVGAATQVTGFRASLIVYDDIETAQTVESAVKSEAINTYAMEAQNLLMSGKDESITLCTPHSMNSIYTDWITSKGFKPFVIPAYYVEDDSPYFGGLAPFIKERVAKDKTLVGRAVDERINDEFLQSRKLIIGKSKFKLQYMLDVTESDALRYPLKLSDFIVMNVDDDIAPLKIVYSSMPDKRLFIKHNGFAKDYLYQPAYTSKETGEYDYKIMAIDPAGTGGDELAVSIIYHLNGKLFIKKIVGMQGGYNDEVMENIATLCEIHGIHTIVVEDNYGDGAFRKMLEPHILRRSPKTEVEGIKVKGQKEVRIIEILEPVLNQHRLVLDREILETDINTNRVYSFTHQLSHITSERDSLRHDDKLDSLSLGVKYMLDWMVDDSERGYEYQLEKQAEEALQFTLQMFQGYRNQKKLNYSNRF